MSVVKNNEQDRAETDLLYKKLDVVMKIGAVNMVSNMAAQDKISIDEIPDFIKRTMNQFVSGFEGATSVLAATRTIAPERQAALPAPSVQPTVEQTPGTAADIQTAAPAASVVVKKAPRKARASKKATEAVSETKAPAEAEVVTEAPAKGRAKKATNVKEATAKVARVKAVEEVKVPKKRGRPRIERDAPISKKAQAPSPFDPSLTQEDNFRIFLRNNPPMLSAEDSLIPQGAKNQMRCIIDGEAVSFLRPYLLRKYGISFEDYKAIYGLAADYPYAPPVYTSRMSNRAKTFGLGTAKIPKVKIADGADDQAAAQTQAAETAQAASAPAETVAEQPTPKARPRNRASRRIEVAANEKAAA